MSIWTEVTGIIQVRYSEHFSIKECCKGLFKDEYSLQYDFIRCSPEHYKIDMRLNFCSDALQAAKLVDELVGIIPGLVDITANIRWVK